MTARSQQRLRPGLWSVVLAAAVLLMAVGAAEAQVGPSPGAADRPDVTRLVVGAPVSAQPTEYQEFACGTGDWPPGSPVSGFADFAKCPADALGLHEVEFRYDDEVHYWGLAMSEPSYADRWAGTKLGNFDVIASGLFDDAGVLRGVRVVTDNRVPDAQRLIAYQLSLLIKSSYGDAAGWACVSEPAAEGETPIGRYLIKDDCTATLVGGEHALLTVRLLRRTGQGGIDPHTGQRTQGQYTSLTRFEYYDLSVKLPAGLEAAAP